MKNIEKIKKININQEMSDSFLDYAMSVIVSRALPDVRDGMKPVHRRILYAMNQIGNHASKSYQKSARTIGEVIGKYHPHGDASVYSALVRMAQDFSYRYPLIDGHGNFGSLDGDNAAAMRYTEAKMSRLAMYMVEDINKNTIDMQDNYDGKEQEPKVLPSKLPNLLVNGSTGIAVGMATNIPPHNLKEVIDGTIALIENPHIEVKELMSFIKGPDFPTGGITLGLSGIHSAYKNGKGSIITKARAKIVAKEKGKNDIIITEIPYQINKSELMKSIASLVTGKTILGISDIRDESNYKGLRIVIQLKRNVNARIILNQLFKHTKLQTTFPFNNVVLVNGEPKRLNLKETIKFYIEHQLEVLRRKTKFNLDKAEKRIHILEGLQIALDNINEVVDLIKKSTSSEEAQGKLVAIYKLSKLQAKAILEMKLSRLTNLERKKLLLEIDELNTKTINYKEILNNPNKANSLIVDQLNEIKEKFGDKRRTEIDPFAKTSIENEELIPIKNIIITLSSSGYIKRTLVDDYKFQNRGGKGAKGQSIVENDNIYRMLYTKTHSDLLLFSNKGKVYKIRAHQVPHKDRKSKGVPVINLIDIEKNEFINSIISLEDYSETTFLTFATAQGLVKKTKSSEYQNVRKSGKKAIKLQNDDQLVDVKKTSLNDEIILANTNGKVVRFSSSEVRSTARNTRGVKGMTVKDGQVASFAITNNFTHLLSVSSNGKGKLTPIKKYRLTKRKAIGIKAIKISKKVNLVEIIALNRDSDLMLMTKKGMVSKIKASQISVFGRNSQGVKLMNLGDDRRIQCVILLENKNSIQVPTPKSTSSKIDEIASLF